MVNESVDAGGVFADGFFSVEVWDALSANRSCEDILMRVNEGVDTLLAELSDEFINLCEVSEVVFTAGAFDGLPHNAESDKVHAPLVEVFDVLVI